MNSLAWDIILIKVHLLPVCLPPKHLYRPWNTSGSFGRPLPQNTALHPSTGCSSACFKLQVMSPFGVISHQGCHTPPLGSPASSSLWKPPSVPVSCISFQRCLVIYQQNTHIIFPHMKESKRAYNIFFSGSYFPHPFS